ncbi:BAG family molecular chaperone regulator 4-like [Malania oleifera]|uniref:BAG family molecular chaperone regulator 4-like n=1 Tax=Malania oleifera TaxID=397392 RepID=UPI0025ADC6BB|nr:BAG family molecular chaperone regulator 4-like [Malania oleifera]
MKRSSSAKSVIERVHNQEIEWELRPGGMLVQKRNDIGAVSSSSSGPMIKVKVSHGSYHHDVTVPAQASFGDLKMILAHETGLEPKEQRLLFRGKEKEDEESLYMAGVKDMSKVILLEDPASKERKLEEMKRDQYLLKARVAVTKVTEEVDKISEKVFALERAVCSGTKVVDKEFVVLTELLMVQLLQLDAIEADGDAKVQRRIEVRRIQSFVEKLDNLKARNSNPFSSSGNKNAASAATKWEAFGSGVGSLSDPSVPLQSSTKITQDWELFD